MGQVRSKMAKLDSPSTKSTQDQVAQQRLLFRVLRGWKCKGTHHKLGMDALTLLSVDQASRWTDLFLAHVEPFLDGTKAPDKTFKDFRNHVLHVADNFWGGAPKTARLWYERCLNAFQQKDWQRGVYAAGVLSHYITDPIMPLHTGQTEKEGTIHRACEWSASKSYDALAPLSIVTGHAIEFESRADWLEQFVIDNAEIAHAEYHTIVNKYDLDVGVKNPPAGLNAELQTIIRALLARGCVAFSAVLNRVIVESGVTPPEQNLSLQTVLASATIPVFWITKKLADAQDRKIVKAIYDELQATGKVEKSLPEDERTVKQLYEWEVLGKRDEPSPRKSPPSKSKSNPKVARREPPAPKTEKGRKFYLHADDPVVDGPSIGPKTAKRLKRIGINTVADLLNADVNDSVSALDLRYIDAELFTAWQQQADIMCAVPTLRCHDAQILVGCHILTAVNLADADAKQLTQEATLYVNSAESKRFLRETKPPDGEEVRDWIAAAQSVTGQDEQLCERLAS